MPLYLPPIRRVARAFRRLLPLFGLILFATLAMRLGFLLGRPRPTPAKAGQLEVTVLNVGQGEASYIRTLGGKFIVIGGGPPGAGQRLIRSLQQAGARRIDLLILPYPYAEAMGGAPDLIKAFPVRAAVETGEARIINQFQEQTRALLRESSVPRRAARAGDRFVVDGARIDILAPAEPLSRTTPAAANNSLVVRLLWGKTGFLWAGGLESAGEQALLSRTPDLSAEWLRVARFGTRGATSAEFLRLVEPMIAVISVGANQSGFPHRETLERLEMMGARLVRTDQTGSVELRFYSDGERVSGP